MNVWDEMKQIRKLISEKASQTASELRVTIPAVFLAMKRRDTPFAAKLMAGITVAYALSPLDIVPDFIPVLGYLDDLILLPLFAGLTVRLIPPDILTDCRREAEGLWQGGKPKKWYFAIPVVVFWLGILWLVIRQFIK